MAGKSGRSISNVPEKALKKNILSWEGMLVVVFILMAIFCSAISENFHLENVLREMPKYLAEAFIMLPMAYVLILGEIDISVGATVCLSATLTVWHATRTFRLSWLFLYACWWELHAG